MEILIEIILRAACMLVPSGMRKEWLAEWRAEAWYVRERSSRNPAIFCCGAIPDAVCVWRSTPWGTPLASPVTCVWVLAALVALCVLQISRLPGGLHAQFAVHSQIQGLVALWRDGRPAVAIETYRELTKTKTRRFAATAFFHAPTNVEIPGVGQLLLARATSSLLEVLQLEKSARNDSSGSVVLTPAAYREHFGSSRIRIGSLAGIAPDYSGPLAGQIDGWLIDDGVVNDGASGYVLARIAPDQQSGRLRLPLGFIPRPVGTSFAETATLFVFLTLVACALLPVATSWSLGELPAQANRHRGFFLMKLSLILVIAYCGAAHLSCVKTGQTGSPFLLHVYLPIYILALRWVIHDQRRRCPVCLRLLGNAASIGESSRIFLDRNITELVCARGHGLMHIPETPTSWFAVQRWSPLDASWQGLFTR
jgi:hypothetical protein